jgi:prepilin-type N-terminal cleavage/methylation domain-containing protein
LLKYDHKTQDITETTSRVRIVFTRTSEEEIRMKNRRGFTLVEMVIVIAIIVFLAGVTLNGLSQYSKRANDLKANMNAHSAAIQSQEAIIDGYLMSSRPTTANATTNNSVQAGGQNIPYEQPTETSQTQATAPQTEATQAQTEATQTQTEATTTQTEATTTTTQATLPDPSAPIGYFKFSDHIGYRTWWDLFHTVYNIDIENCSDPRIATIITYNKLDPATYTGPNSGDKLLLPPQGVLTGEIPITFNAGGSSTAETTGETNPGEITSSIHIT